MERVHHRLRRFGLPWALALLFGACAAPQEPPPEAAAPSARRTVCDAQWEPGPADRSEVAGSFAAFSRGWLERLRSAAAQRPPSGVRKRIPDRHETELRPTASAAAPYVGVLRYCEQTLRCAGGAEASCSLSSHSVVTELFRYQGGAWIH